MKKYILTLLSLLSVMAVNAQKISFDKETINVGLTKWHTPVTAVFTFTNKDRNPLYIKNVDAGCGCLQPQWTLDRIDRNGKGEIRITYDAALIGSFDRIVYVYTNAQEKPHRIRMKGKVGGGSHKTREELFPYSIGDIMLSTNNIEFLDTKSGDSTTVRLELFNGSDEVFTPQLMHLPDYLTATIRPEMVARDKRCYIDITLHADKLPNMGLNQTSIYLARYSGDKVSKENEIAVSAVRLPMISSLPGSRTAPKFEVSSTELDFTNAAKKAKMKGVVVIKNTGHGVLKLDGIQVFNQAISVSMAKRELYPGESVNMNIVLNTKLLSQYKAAPRILIISNDAEHPKETITIKVP